MIRAFMDTLRLESSDTVWTDATYPSNYTMRALGTLLSASLLLRRDMFRMCQAAASGQDGLCNVFKDIVSLLKGAGMTHIMLINEYLYSRHRELLSLRVLAEDYEGMMAAREFLASLPPEDVYYAKILYDRWTTACLDGKYFPLYVAAAVAAAKFEKHYVTTYRGAEGQSMSSILVEEIVKSHLAQKLSRAPIAMINELAVFGPSHEVEYRRPTDVKKEEQREQPTIRQERGQPAFLLPASATIRKERDQPAFLLPPSATIREERGQPAFLLPPSATIRQERGQPTFLPPSPGKD
jgi:hypothetical protein